MTSDRGSSGGAEMQLDNPVTPKSPGLNPNASVFLSCKSNPGVPDTGQWEHSDSGINSSSDYSYANGDISSDKSDTGVFSPTSDSPFQPEFTPLTDNQVLSSDSNANVTAKFEDAPGRATTDSQGGLSPEVPVSKFVGEGSVPMTGITYTSDNSGVPDPETPAVEGTTSEDQLRQVLKQQLETYFSRENLSSDSYLQSQMDADQYVPIATVASLDQIQKFNCDIQLIVELLKESSVVQVDDKEEKVRPNHNRCIVILREIPDSTPVEEVQNLFSGENCPKFVSCQLIHNSNWYVTFDSDADAQRAYRYLREEVRTFQGKPIMARIKANALIRTSSYPPRNGYNINKFAATQQPQQQSQQPLQEVPTSAATQQQTAQPFTGTQPFTLMPNVSQYINGQQAIPFYPPPNPLLQTWPTANPTMLDPSMVLALNGYQATNVKMNVGPNRNIPYTNTSMNRNNNIRNQKMHNNNRPMNHERNDPPPRMMNQDRPPSNSNGNNFNKTSPRNSDSSLISNHQHMYPGRRLDGVGSHNHMAHGGPPPPPPPPHVNQQHPDNTNNNVALNSRIGDHIPISQRYPPERFPNKSYKSRRRRDEEGANRPARLSSSSQPPNSAGGNTREGSQGRYGSQDRQFDYEPTSFPPLPGSANNASSGEVFESKLSDVVRGTAKAQVKEVTKSTAASTSSAPSSSTATTTPCSTHTSTSSTANRDKPSPNIATSTRRASSPTPQSQPSQQPPIVARTNSSTSSQPPVSPTIRSTSKPVPSTVSESKSNHPSKGNTVVENTQSQLDDKSSSSAKLSYAQMVQKRREEVAEKADGIDKSDSESETPLQQSNKPNQSLKEQSQSSQSQKNTPAASKTPAKDSLRKDRDSNDREDFRKYREGEPKEQRFNNGRRLKENRENRERPGEKFDRPGRRDFRERDGPRPSAGK